LITSILFSLIAPSSLEMFLFSWNSPSSISWGAEVKVL
jgi:hypothetical protein